MKVLVAFLFIALAIAEIAPVGQLAVPSEKRDVQQSGCFAGKCQDPLFPVCKECGYDSNNILMVGCFKSQYYNWFCCGCIGNTCGVCARLADCSRNGNVYVCGNPTPSGDAGLVVGVIFGSVVFLVIVCVVVAAICRNAGCGYYSTYSNPSVTYHTSTYSSGIGYGGNTGYSGGNTYNAGMGYSSGGSGGGAYHRSDP